MKKFLFLIVFIFTSCTPILFKTIELSNRINISKDTQRRVGLIYDEVYDALLPKSGYNIEYFEYEDVRYYKLSKKASDNVVIFFHGGAFVNINVSQFYLDLFNSILDGDYNDFEVILVDTKELVYPGQSNNLWKIMDYMKTKYKKMVVAGDSSGGNVVLSTMLQRRDKNKFLPEGLILMSPWTDVSNKLPSRINNYKKDIVLAGNGYPTLLYDNPYVEGQNLEDPYISPIYGKYDKFPKTLIQYGSNEILSDDSIYLERIMKEYGVEVKIEEYEGAYHVFQLISDIPQTKAAIKSITEFLKDTLGGKN